MSEPKVKGKLVNTRAMLLDRVEKAELALAEERHHNEVMLYENMSPIQKAGWQAHMAAAEADLAHLTLRTAILHFQLAQLHADEAKRLNAEGVDEHFGATADFWKKLREEDARASQEPNS